MVSHEIKAKIDKKAKQGEYERLLDELYEDQPSLKPTDCPVQALQDDAQAAVETEAGPPVADKADREIVYPKLYGKRGGPKIPTFYRLSSLGNHSRISRG